VGWVDKRGTGRGGGGMYRVRHTRKKLIPGGLGGTEPVFGPQKKVERRGKKGKKDRYKGRPEENRQHSPREWRYIKYRIGDGAETRSQGPVRRTGENTKNDRSGGGQYANIQNTNSQPSGEMRE